VRQALLVIATVLTVLGLAAAQDKTPTRVSTDPPAAPQALEREDDQILPPSKYCIELMGTGCVALNMPNTVFKGNRATYEAWIFPSTLRQTGNYIYDGNDRRGFDRNFRVSDSKVRIYMNAGPVLTWDSEDKLKADTWNHVVVTLDKDHMAIYINGELSAARHGEVPQHYDTSAVFLGCGRYGEKFWGAQYHGWMTSVRLWTRALTADEVARAFRKEKISFEGLLDSWSFLRGKLRSDRGRYRSGELVGDVKIIRVSARGKAATAPAGKDAPSTSPHGRKTSRRTRLRVPPGFRVKAGTRPEPYTNTGYALEVVHEKTGIEMIFIPAGEFSMGSPLSPQEIVHRYGGNMEWYQGESPVHPVRITRPFYMGKYEVTQDAWRRVMGENPSRFKGDGNPADSVSWNDSQAFLEKAGNGLRLPTEAQWEYACRAGTRTAYCFGDDPGPLGDYGWLLANSKKSTHPAGRKRPNAWGLYDMYGNVWEWCSDWFDQDYYR